jgi:ribosomal protein L25 (general stress protein Ctc)
MSDGTDGDASTALRDDDKSKGYIYGHTKEHDQQITIDKAKRATCGMRADESFIGLSLTL